MRKSAPDWLRGLSQDLARRPLPLCLQEAVLLALADVLPDAKRKRKDRWRRILVGIHHASRRKARHAVLSSVGFKADQRLEKLLESARRRRAPGRALTWRERMRDGNRWYLHFRVGLTYREIAWLEQQFGPRDCLTSTAIAKAIDRRPKPLSKSMSGESSVRESVKRAQQEHSPLTEPYRARRRRLEALPDYIETYHCPDHGSGCGPRCSYMLGWKQRIEAFLPSDRSGT